MGFHNQGGISKATQAEAEAGTDDTKWMSPLKAQQAISSPNNNIVMPSGNGIDFSATADGSGTTTSEVFDDYEEGTWTPAVDYATTGDLSVAYSAQVGQYTKIGNVCHVQCQLNTSTHTYTTASGSLKINGLPFTVLSSINSVCIARWTGLNIQAGYTQVTTNIVAGQTHAVFAQHGDNIGEAGVTTSDTTSGAQVGMWFTGQYIVQ